MEDPLNPAFIEFEVNDLSDPVDAAATEVVDEAVCSYRCAPACDHRLKNPSEILQHIKGQCLQGCGYCVLNGGQRHLPVRTLTFLAEMSNEVLRRQYTPLAWNTFE